MRRSGYQTHASLSMDGLANMTHEALVSRYAVFTESCLFRILLRRRANSELPQGVGKPVDAIGKLGIGITSVIIMNGDFSGAIRTKIALKQIARCVVRLREFNDRGADLAVVRIDGKHHLVSP